MLNLPPAAPMPKAGVPLHLYSKLEDGLAVTPLAASPLRSQKADSTGFPYRINESNPGVN